jgi:hypothetical protein
VQSDTHRDGQNDRYKQHRPASRFNLDGGGGIVICGRRPLINLSPLDRKLDNLGASSAFLALAAIYEGASRTQAARIGEVTVQVVRDCVVKFNAGGNIGL